MSQTMSSQRIASLLASGTEILYGLGLGERVVAVSHECDYPKQVKHKPRVTFTNIAVEAASRTIDEQVKNLTATGAPIYNIEVELLASLRPDLIVTQSQCDVCAVSYNDVLAAVQTHPTLRSTKIVTLNPTTLEAVFADILRVGEAAGCERRAREYLAGLRERVETIRTKTASLAAGDRPRVACIEWIDPVMIAANWMPELVEIAGGQNGLTRTGAKSAYSRWDDVVAYDPEVVVVMPCGFDLRRTVEEAKVLTSFPGWTNLAAVRKGRVFAMDGNAYFNRSGPRIVDSLEILAQLLHPQLFAKTESATAISRQLLSIGDKFRI